MPKQFHPEDDSPLRSTEVLHQRMSDTQLYPQISFRPGLLQTPREERLRTCLSTEEGAKSRLSKYLGPRNDRPTSRPGKPASSTDAVEKLTSVWTTWYGCIVERANMDTKLDPHR